MTQQAEFYSQAIQLMAIIVIIVKISGAAFVTASFSYLLDYCLMDHSIFGRWLPFLARIIVKLKSRQKYNTFIAAKGNRRATDEMFIQECITNPAWKLLGGCPICMGVWLTLGVWWLFSWWLHLPLYTYPVFVVITSFILRRVMLSGDNR